MRLFLAINLPPAMRRALMEATLPMHTLAPERQMLLRDAVKGAGFRRVAIDLRGFRSGSLNVLTGVTAAA